MSQENEQDFNEGALGEDILDVFHDDALTDEEEDLYKEPEDEDAEIYHFDMFEDEEENY